MDQDLKNSQRPVNPENVTCSAMKNSLKNLGQASLKLLGEVLASASEYGFEFVNAREYRKLYKV